MIKVIVILLAAAAVAAPQALPTRGAKAAAAEYACAGIGLADRNDPRWASYNVRVEFSNPQAEYLSDGAVEVHDLTGRPVISARCDTPWVLLRLAPGAYRIDATASGVSKSAPVAAPQTGQQRVVMQFPDG